MTACRNWSDRLLDYALGALEASSVRDVEAHLNTCPACTAALVDLRARRDQMDTALLQLAQGAEPAPDFRARVLAAAESAAARGARRPAWVGAVAAGAVVLLAAVLLPWLGEQPPTPTGVATLSEWRSPTASLLRAPGRELLEAPPRLGELYFVIESPPAVTGEDKGGNNES